MMRAIAATSASSHITQTPSIRIVPHRWVTLISRSPLEWPRMPQERRGPGERPPARLRSLGSRGGLVLRPPRFDDAGGASPSLHGLPCRPERSGDFVVTLAVQERPLARTDLRIVADGRDALN